MQLDKDAETKVEQRFVERSATEIDEWRNAKTNCVPQRIRPRESQSSLGSVDTT